MSWRIAVRDNARYSLVIANPTIKVQQGEKISIPFRLVGVDNFKTSVQIGVIGGPPGLNPQTVTVTPGKDGTVSLDAKGGQPIPPGTYTIFLRGQTQPTNPKVIVAARPKAGVPSNIVQISMPVSVTIVPKTPGKMSALPKISVENSVKFARAYDVPRALGIRCNRQINLRAGTARFSSGAAMSKSLQILRTVFGLTSGWRGTAVMRVPSALV